MGTPRPKITFNLDDAEHRALKVLAEAEGLTQIEWTEKVVKSAIASKVHETSLLANKLQRAGIIGNFPESAAISERGGK